MEPPEDFPFIIEHIWSAFIQLSQTRSAGFSGPNPITYSEIKAWMEVTHTPLRSWEVEAIKRLDTAYMGVSHG